MASRSLGASCAVPLKTGGVRGHRTGRPAGPALADRAAMGGYIYIYIWFVWVYHPNLSAIR